MYLYLHDLDNHWNKCSFHCSQKKGEAQDDHVKVKARKHDPQILLTIVSDLSVLSEAY